MCFYFGHRSLKMRLARRHQSDLRLWCQNIKSIGLGKKRLSRSNLRMLKKNAHRQGIFWECWGEILPTHKEHDAYCKHQTIKSTLYKSLRICCSSKIHRFWDICWKEISRVPEQCPCWSLVLLPHSPIAEGRLIFKAVFFGSLGDVL